MQNWNEAEKEFLTVLEHRQKTLPPDSLDIQRTNGFLARLYAKQERWTEASRFIAALLLSQKADTARSIETLASEIESAMSESSDPKVAEPLLRECVEGVQNALWQGDWLSGELASRHGDCIRRAARPADAELILINSAKEIAHSIAPPEWSVRKSRKRVADVYLDLKKPEEAAAGKVRTVTLLDKHDSIINGESRSRKKRHNSEPRSTIVEQIHHSAMYWSQRVSVLLG